MSSPNGVQCSYLRRKNCGPKRKLYSFVCTSNVGVVVGQNDGVPPQLGNGACVPVGIFEVPKYWPPSTTKPSHGVAFRPKEASQPYSPAQCPALKRPASAYVPPPNSS